MTWDLASYFAEFNGAEMVQFKAAIRADVAALQQTAVSLPTLTTQSANVWEDILMRNEDLSRRMSHLGSYIGCLASSDAGNESYQKEEAEITRTRAELAKVRIECCAPAKPRCQSLEDFCPELRTGRGGGGGKLLPDARRARALDDSGKRNPRPIERRWHPGWAGSMKVSANRIRNGYPAGRGRVCRCRTPAH